jgi:hypothetical protein
MNLRLVASCGLACAAIGLAGCEEGREAPPRVFVRIANAAPGFAELSFRREQEGNRVANLGFKATQDFTYDADTYDFFVYDRVLDTNIPQDVWTFATTLEGRTSYVFVLAEVATQIQPVVIPIPEDTGTATQFVAFHAGESLPAMDLYLEPPGVGIAGATPRGSFNALEQITPRSLPTGDYELTLTAAGDPTNVLLTTSTIGLPASSTSIFVVVPEGGQGTEELSVLLLQGTSTVLYDRDATNELRVVNGATDRVPRDVAVDSQFSPPLFPAAPFGEQTTPAQMPLALSAQITVTPVGNPGVLELDQTYIGSQAQRATMLFTGPAGTLVGATALDDGRRIHGEAKLRFLNAVSQFAGLDFVLTLPDGDPNLLLPYASLGTPGISQYAALPPRDFDLYVRQFATTTIVSGPTRITLADGGIYGVLAVDGPDTATVSLVFFDDFP